MSAPAEPVVSEKTRPPWVVWLYAVTAVLDLFLAVVAPSTFFRVMWGFSGLMLVVLVVRRGRPIGVRRVPR